MLDEKTEVKIIVGKRLWHWNNTVYIV